MMHVLLIEDEDLVVDALTVALEASRIGVTVNRVGSRKAAIDVLIQGSHFDLVITDLKIPSVDGALDATTAYGREVYATVRRDRPGTPVWVFSGYADEDFLEGIIDEARRGDPFGIGLKAPMIRCFRKLHLSRVVDELRSVAPLVQAVAGIEVSTAGLDLGLRPEAIRLIQLVCRRFGGTTIRLKALSPGYSAATTVRAHIVDQHGAQVASCVLKIGPRAELEEEALRYENNVPLALTATCFAPIAGVFADGVAHTVALAYTVASSDPKSLGEILGFDESRAVAVVQRLREVEQLWLQAGHTEQLTVSEVCHLLSAPDVQGVTLDSSDQGPSIIGLRSIQVLKAPQHGDLHLGNVLVGGTSEPVLIDYGRTGHRVSAYDPVTLEMCLGFHPDGRVVAGGWPTPAHAAQFDQLSEYLDGCPCPLFVQTCREWAHAVANGDREVWAAILGYALRQLQFPDTSDELALAYARRACELLS